MRPRALVAGLLLIASLSGCGAADTVAPSAPATGAPAAQAPPTSAATAAPPTQRPAAPTEVPTMPDKPSPTPQPPAPTAPAQTGQGQPAPPTPTRPVSRAAPLGPPATGVPAPNPRNSAIVAPPLGPALTAMVDDSRADLARRQSVALEDVALVAVWTVVWPDGGLGCPRPGMVYPQVQVDGLLIRLRIGERTFDYHTDGRKPPFLCEGKYRAAPRAPAPAPGTGQDK